MKRTLLIIAACAALWSGDAIADDAMIVALRGNVYSEAVVLHQGDTVKQGETIRTEDRSFAVLQFSDGSKITIRPDSEIYLDTVQADVVQLDLISGGLRVISGTIAKNNPENYTVDTPVALMGVRGTEFSIQIVDQK